MLTCLRLYCLSLVRSNSTPDVAVAVAVAVAADVAAVTVCTHSVFLIKIMHYNKNKENIKFKKA